MLFNTVHIPEVYRRIPKNLANRDTYCELLVLRLREALRDCQILVDPQEEISQAIERAIKKWPEAHKKEAQELLIALSRRHRLIPFVPSNDQVMPATCGSPSCRPAFEIAVDPRSQLDLILTVPGCQGCNVLNKASDVNHYSLSPFAKECSRKETVRIDPSTWDKVRFEREILGPVFRNAKQVVLIDKYPAKNMMRVGGRVLMKKRWRDNLDWIIEQVGAYSIRTSPPGIIVYCEYHASKSITYEETSRSMMDWAHDWSQRTRPLSVKTEVIKADPKIPEQKRQSDGNAKVRMTHARWLVTDQIILLIESGFDLLEMSEEAGGDQNAIRDSVVSRLAWEPELEAAINKIDSPSIGEDVLSLVIREMSCISPQ